VLAGRSIVDVNVRQRFGLVVVGIQRAGGKMEFNPPGDAVMQAGDQLVVLGRADGLRQLELAAAHAEA
jgi:voltage-gated potassium channel